MLHASLYTNFHEEAYFYVKFYNNKHFAIVATFPEQTTWNLTRRIIFDVETVKGLRSLIANLSLCNPHGTPSRCLLRTCPLLFLCTPLLISPLPPPPPLSLHLPVFVLNDQNEAESGDAVKAKEAAITEQAKAVGAAEGRLKKAEAEHACLQEEYQGMCAGVASKKEESRTLTDQVGLCICPMQ